MQEEVYSKNVVNQLGLFARGVDTFVEVLCYDRDGLQMVCALNPVMLCGGLPVAQGVE